MKLIRRWQIPDYPKYYIEINPFRVIGKYGRPLAFNFQSHGHPNVLLSNKMKKQRISIVKLACIAFHGKQPEGYLAHFSDNDYNKMSPFTVCWKIQNAVMSLERQTYTEKERKKMLKMYFQEGYTQKEIAERFRKDRSTITRAINKRR